MTFSEAFQWTPPQAFSPFHIQGKTKLRPRPRLFNIEHLSNQPPKHRKWSRNRRKKPALFFSWAERPTFVSCTNGQDTPSRHIQTWVLRAEKWRVPMELLCETPKLDLFLGPC